MKKSVARKGKCIIVIWCLLMGVISSMGFTIKENKTQYKGMLERIDTIQALNSCTNRIRHLSLTSAKAREINVKAEIKRQEELKRQEEERTKQQQLVTASQVVYQQQQGRLNTQCGVFYGPSGKETYYNLNMDGVVGIMRGMGNNDAYWVREDGAKMLGDYVMVAAHLGVHPRGSLVETSLGTGIVCDTGGFASSNPTQIDIATAW